MEAERWALQELTTWRDQQSQTNVFDIQVLSGDIDRFTVCTSLRIILFFLKASFQEKERLFAGSVIEPELIFVQTMSLGDTPATTAPTHLFAFISKSAITKHRIFWLRIIPGKEVTEAVDSKYWLWHLRWSRSIHEEHCWNRFPRLERTTQQWKLSNWKPPTEMLRKSIFYVCRRLWGNTFIRAHFEEKKISKNTNNGIDSYHYDNNNNMTILQ